MRHPGGRGDPCAQRRGRPGYPSRPERYHLAAGKQETGMERTDWMNAGLDSADARFLMLTAITHHRFTSPAWGENEVRKLHDELAEVDALATRAVSDHCAAREARRWPGIRYWVAVRYAAHVGRDHDLHRGRIRLRGPD